MDLTWRPSLWVFFLFLLPLFTSVTLVEYIYIYIYKIYPCELPSDLSSRRRGINKTHIFGQGLSSTSDFHMISCHPHHQSERLFFFSLLIVFKKNYKINRKTCLNVKNSKPTEKRV